MKEKGNETFKGISLYGLAERLRDSKAIIRSTYPAGRFDLKVSINSVPNILARSSSKSLSTPTIKDVIHDIVHLHN